LIAFGLFRIILAGFSGRANRLAKPMSEMAPCCPNKETHEIDGGIDQNVALNLRSVMTTPANEPSEKVSQ
jgi:hypothetical protein